MSAHVLVCQPTYGQKVFAIPTGFLAISSIFRNLAKRVKENFLCFPFYVDPVKQMFMALVQANKHQRHFSGPCNDTCFL